EEAEVLEKKISVSSAEVYDDIKKTAARNNMGVSELYEAVRTSNGLSSSEFKTKTKEKLLSQKLYAAIAYSSVSQPSDEETLEYYELHKEEFEHPVAFKATIYTAEDKELLAKKITNPMFYSTSISQSKQRLEYEKISPDLAKFLAQAKPNSFTPMIPDGKGAYMTFYITEIEEGKKVSYESVKDNISNLIMADKREQVLSDYFARLKNNADIRVIREVE
ncbi:MAG: peptidylprolyl isomerase, partial [Sulfurimonas sp.]|nr:peptidylprolyl isomerase [Sulfurimonas sp.]